MSHGLPVSQKKVTGRAESILTETMNRDVPSGSRPQRYTQILLFDNENPPGPDNAHPDLKDLPVSILTR